MRRLCSIVVFMALIATGCGKTQTAEKAGAPAGSSGSSSSTARPLDSIMRAYRAQLDLKSFRVRIESTSPATGTLSRIAEYVSPDRFHMKGDKDETIIIGPTVFMRMGDRQWTKAPGEVGSLISSIRDPKFAETLSKSTDVSLVGPDVVDGTPALAYRYTTTNAFGSTNIASTSKVWVRASDGLPLKVEAESEFNGHKQTTTLTYYDFNADIKIEPPM